MKDAAEEDADKTCYNEQDHAKEEVITQARKVTFRCPGVNGQYQRCDSRDQKGLSKDIAVSYRQVGGDKRRE